MQSDKVLQLSQVYDTISIAAFNELIQRVERLEKLLLKRREMAIIELGAIEDGFDLVRTKEKRIR